MVSLIPMAGRGNRFFQERYNIPKPFIPVMKSPMFITSIKSFPISDKYIFICLKEHYQRYKLENLIKDNFKRSEIILVDKVTEGQACTCLLAEDKLDINEGLFIASCDYQTIYNKDKYEKLLNDDKIDVIIWTFKIGSVKKANPNIFAYCRTDGERVTEVVEKRTISKTPHLDPAVVGSFTYKKSELFIRGAKKMISKNIHVNNEFYVGTSINQLIEEGYNVVTFEIDKFISFGTPFELMYMQYWEDYFAKLQDHPYSITYGSKMVNGYKMRKPELSIILPCYNESPNIPIVVKRLSGFFNEINFELILVNNGSTDDTGKVLEEMKKDNDFLCVVTVERNIGYGHGIMSGLKASRADILAYSHADIQMPPEDIIKAYRLLKEKECNPEGVLIKGLRVNRRKEEQSLTKSLERTCGVLLGYEMRDINGQPKLFHRGLLEKLAHPPVDFSFDVYVMYKAAQNGLRIITFPVDFGLRLHGESKWSVSPLKKYKTILGYLKNILFISLNNIYDNNNPIKQLAKFALVGILGVSINYGTFYLLYKIFSVYYMVSSLVGYLPAGVMIFFLNRYWTFNVKHEQKAKQLVQFISLISFTFFLNGITIYFLTDIIHIRAEISQIITMAVTITVNFLGSNFWVFRKG